MCAVSAEKYMLPVCALSQIDDFSMASGKDDVVKVFPNDFVYIAALKKIKYNYIWASLNSIKMFNNISLYRNFK